MPRSQDPQSRDLPVLSTLHYNSAIFLYQISTSFLEERSLMCLRSTISLGDYLQINDFLASSGRLENNPLQLKPIEN